MKKLVSYISIILIIGIVAFLIIKYNNNSKTDILNDNIEKELTVSFNGYLYTLPINYKYSFEKKSDGSGLKIINNDEHWGAGIYLIDNSKYNDNKDIFTNYDDAKKSFIESGMDIRDVKYIDNGNFPIVSFEYYYEEYKGIYAYLKAYDNYIYQIELFSEDNEFNYDALNEIADILLAGVKE